ncbi:MAG: hypothetical protein SFU98_20410 [Leptospiraceae bacterium]|nr:hypothetical protein [Leptospiraceae bacterium]
MHITLTQKKILTVFGIFFMTLFLFVVYLNFSFQKCKYLVYDSKGNFEEIIIYNFFNSCNTQPFFEDNRFWINPEWNCSSTTTCIRK